MCHDVKTAWISVNECSYLDIWNGTYNRKPDWNGENLALCIKIPPDILGMEKTEDGSGLK